MQLTWFGSSYRLCHFSRFSLFFTHTKQQILSQEELGIDCLQNKSVEVLLLSGTDKTEHTAMCFRVYDSVATWARDFAANLTVRHKKSTARRTELILNQVKCVSSLFHCFCLAFLAKKTFFAWSSEIWERTRLPRVSCCVTNDQGMFAIKIRSTRTDFPLLFLERFSCDLRWSNLIDTNLL